MISGHANKAGHIASLLLGARVLLRACGVVLVVILGGFIWFLAQLQSDEAPPKNPADGIVVLTGGSSRVSDAVDLLANGYGKRLLISGVHWSTGTGELSRSLRDNASWLACCVDLDYFAFDTRGNATETRRWAHERGFRSLIVVTSNYHMPRAIVELSHSMPDVVLIPFPVIGEKWRDEPWWASGAAARLLVTEYAKFLAAGVRVHFDDWVLPETPSAPPIEVSRKRASAGN
ncbi:YdcF family protein [Bradyrhizobium sp. LHD-71]|uniref:YdcF family protein n=1 Tax=Bradyrhizobium sp. LHD-71 TaxID=3072141 RepID=UPI00280D0073|nr:YdcF family protein [Bradyrhizobium sp. LHD-71]MDQ8730576.1 YdcF family protein [Bradyrhizobium sp. LHD-71]